MAKIAKLAIQSNLPQLDRLFDYLIPESLQDSVMIGSRVKAPFGRSKKLHEAFVADLADTTDFSGKLSEIADVVGDVAALQPAVLELCKQLAERSASTLGELLKIAVPAHMPRAQATHTLASHTSPAEALSQTISSYESGLALQPGAKYFALAEPRHRLFSNSSTEISVPSWVADFITIAGNNLSLGKSTILLVPDYREHEVLLDAISRVGLGEFVANYSQEQAKSKIYLAFLSALDASPKIIIGSRSAAYAPAHNLGSILVFDEGDRSYLDQSAPYLNTREVVLVRQAIEGCAIAFVSHSISTEMKRLIDSGYLVDATRPFAAPRVSNSEPGFRVDSQAYAAIKLGLQSGPVLVQVASLGESTAMYCQKCDEQARCKECNGPVWVDTNSVTKCRWCNAFALDLRCSCGSSDFSLGRAGSTRTAAELGRAFPAARVIESTGDNRILRVPKGKVLVVATNGAEPYVDGGYEAVILLDAKVALARQSLRAQEEAVRGWSNAIAKGSLKAACVLVGITGELSKLFTLWNHSKIAETEYQARVELQLPPAIRLGSLTGEQEVINQLDTFLNQQPKIMRIGPAPVPEIGGAKQWRLLFKYPYSEGVQLSKMIKAEVARVSAGKLRQAASGKNTRAVTVKMNDAEVV